MEKKLYRKTNGQMICGVCNGIAEYLQLDVTLVRIITVLACFGGGGGLILYIIAAIIMPVDPNENYMNNPMNNQMNNQMNNPTDHSVDNPDEYNKY